jgi:hypothetical protein
MRLISVQPLIGGLAPTSGLAISLIVIFLCLSLPKGGIPFNWWGNVDAFNTAVYRIFAMA